MVSFFSFFTKKKQKRPTSPTSPDPDQPISSSARPKPAQRFLSLRIQSKSRPYNISERRNSSDVQRRRSYRQNVAKGEAPRLDLAFEVRAGEGKDGTGLAFEESRTVTENEMLVLKELRFTLDEVEKGWKWFGDALRRSGTCAL
jgi:hypothetical protein